MALWALEKPPFGAFFHDFSDDFLRVFLRAFPSGRKLARMRPRKALVQGSRVRGGAFSSAWHNAEPAYGPLVSSKPVGD
jgi:hypothetical protein